MARPLCDFCLPHELKPHGRVRGGDGRELGSVARVGDGTAGGEESVCGARVEEEVDDGHDAGGFPHDGSGVVVVGDHKWDMGELQRRHVFAVGVSLGNWRGR